MAVPLAAMKPQHELGPNRRPGWEAGLVIRRDDPFFFDHPLDHVPAMLLVEGALLLAGEASAGMDGGGPPPNFRALHLEFHEFCEFGEPPVIRVWADPGEPGTWRVEFSQGGRKIGEGAAQRCRSRDAADSGGFGARGCAGGEAKGRHGAIARQPVVRRVPAEAVHRSRAENVLIGGLAQLGGDQYAVELITPPSGHYLRRQPGRLRSLSELIEAARQFGTLLAHHACGVGMDRRFVVKSLDITLNRVVSRDEGVVICCSELPKARGRGAMAFQFLSFAPAADPVSRRAPAEVIGAARLAGHAVSAQAYERLRRAAMAVAEGGRPL